MAALHVVACLGISYAHAAGLPEQSVAGSYEILICKGSCPAAGDRDVWVKGRLVLFPANLRQPELARVHVSSHMHGIPNGCFGLKKLPGRSYVGYAGIEEAGTTEWSIEGDQLHFALYHSPDAGYRVTVQRTTTGFDGTGQSWGVGMGAPKDSTLDKVVLRRTGAADLRQCPPKAH